MDKKQIALGFGVLLLLAFVGVALADGQSQGLQRLVVVNGMALMFLCLALVVRETRRAGGLLAAESLPPRPARSTFLLVAACCTAAWLSTSLLLGGISWSAWLAAYAGLLAFGCGALYLRWRFRSLMPMLAYGLAFVVFAHTL